MKTPRKIALVTGAGSGIGREAAKALLAAGYAVVLAGRRAEALAATAAESGAPADQFLAVPTDITQPAAVKNLFARTREVFGRLDVLFNNAGVSTPSMPLEEFAFEQWQEVIKTNLTGPFLCTQEAFRLMKSQRPQGGRIINNGSISAHVPRFNNAPYTTSKTGVTGLTKATALEGRRFNIACGQIDIGNCDTTMAGGMRGGVPQADGSIAVEPVMDVQCVVQAVLYMAGLPLNANVPNVTVIATGMPYIGRG
ncbi:MAG: SDR family oxidoreductase [Verrucomicrobiota bacterium]|jgi:NAD(P)-dependent dehydrogenase (short-subunit alcohol dehydrogenase family)